MMSKSLPDLVNLIAWEKIDCRLNLGFEMKSPDMEDLKKTINFMIQEGGYKPTEIKINTDDQVFNLPTHPRSVSIKGMGQVNLQELLLALVHRIKEMGGQVNEGVRYEGQHMNRDGSYTIHTNQGDYHTTRKPFLATGAQHQNTLPEFERANCKIIHTMGIVIGPLSPEDAARVSTEGKPMAFADTDLGGDILWGGLDEKRFLTIGRGDTEDSSEKNRERTHQDIMKQVENLYPGLSKYSRHVSFGPMLCAKNGLPVVGRMENYDVAGAWGNFGILPGFTAARAYANWLVKGNDAELKIFESMQPEVFFSPEPIADLTGTYSTRL